MFEVREKFKWNVTVHTSDGQIYEREAESYWSPEKDGMDNIMNAVQGEEGAIAARNKLQCRVVSAALILEPVAA